MRVLDPSFETQSVRCHGGTLAIPAPSHVADQMRQPLYGRLRRLARQFLLKERSGHTLQPTALVHEAFLRLLDQQQCAQDESHYVALAARMMRRILVNHALSRRAEKRGGGAAHVSLDDDMDIAAEDQDTDLVSLDAALKDLAALDERQARLVELRYFCGLSVEEAAHTLGVSVSTAKRDWLTARLWLRHRLQD